MNSVFKRLKNYQEVYYLGENSVFQKSKIKGKFHSQYTRYGQPNEVAGGGFAKRELLELLPSDTVEQTDIAITHRYDRNLKKDAFHLVITKGTGVELTASNERGLKYGMEALEKAIYSSNQQVVVPELTIHHEPSFPIRGVIEGFYGIPWTHDSRLDCIHFLGKHQMNTYMYAPKDDELQRKLWREKYPAEKIEDFEELLVASQNALVDFYYMISPGNDIVYTKEAEVGVLQQKLKQMIEIGVSHFGLLLDDIDYYLKGEAKQKFGTPGLAHAYLIKQIYSYLKNELAHCQLVICPTEYDTRYDSVYLHELSDNLPPEVQIFWTGPETLAHEIPTSDIAKMSEIFHHPTIIWDNTPVNDFEDDKERLFLSPYYNRSYRLNQFGVVGIVANPMSQWELSKLTIGNMAKFMWNAPGFDLTTSWQETLADYAGSEYVESLEVFTSHNENKRMIQPLSLELKEALEMRDKDYLNQSLTELNQAVEKLKTLPNKTFQKEIGPWFKRMEQDYQLWQAILAEDHELVRKLGTELKGAKVRIGTNLPLTAALLWGLVD